jgi:hypothetical protein
MTTKQGVEGKKNTGGWNYRVIKMADPKLKGCPQTYYTDNKPTSWSADPQYPIGESWNELYEDYHCMFHAFSQRPLELKGDKLVEGKLFGKF